MTAFLLLAFGVCFTACVSTCTMLITGCSRDADAFRGLATIAVYELTGLLALVFAIAGVESVLTAGMQTYIICRRRKLEAMLQYAAIMQMSIKCPACGHASSRVVSAFWHSICDSCFSQEQSQEKSTECESDDSLPSGKDVCEEAKRDSDTPVSEASTL